jgi:xanthine dehydrogenase accessory factor
MLESHPLTPALLAPILLAAMEKGASAAVLVALTHPDPGKVGSRLLLMEGGTQGTLGDAKADEAGISLARSALDGDPSILPGTYPLPLGEGGALEVFLEVHQPRWELVIVGAGHIAQPLCSIGSLLGLYIRVLDDRPQFATRERFPEADSLQEIDFQDPFAGIPLHRWSHVVLVTRGHKYDYECLRKILIEDTLPGYIGMIGSRRRVRAAFDALLREGISRERLGSVHAPIGLDIGSETPAEIALSVGAELVHHWRGGSGRPLSEMEHVLERFHPEGGVQSASVDSLHRSSRRDGTTSDENRDES